MTATLERRTDLNRLAAVRDMKHKASIVEGRFIDIDANGRGKRLRLLTGEHAGEVLMPGEWRVMEYVDSHAEAAGCIAAAWPD